MRYKVVSGKQLPELPPVIGLDCETMGDGSGFMHPTHHSLTIVQIAVKELDTVFIVNKDFGYLKPLEKVTCVGTFLQFDWQQLYHHLGIELHKVVDVGIVQGLIDAGSPNKLKSHSLKSLTKHYLHKERDKSIREGFFRSKRLTPEKLQYAADDAWDVLDIFELQVEQLKEYQPSKEIFKIEMRVLPEVARMVYKGLKLEEVVWAENDKGRRQRLEEIDKELNSQLTGVYRMGLFGEVHSSVNLNSHAVLKRLLHKHGIDLPDLQRETLKDAYQHFSGKQRELLELLSERSVLQKAVSTYGQSWLKLVSPKTGRIHPTFFQTKSIDGGTISGRFSAADPNTTNVPDEEEYRGCFVAEKGNVFIKADFANQEARITGYYCQDPALLYAFENGINPYVMMARTMFKDPTIQKGDPMYKPAKIIWLALSYGMGVKKLAWSIGCSVQEAQGYMDSVKTSMPKMFNYFQDSVATAEERFYQETVLGRRRYGTPLDPGFFNAMRNHPAQGTGSDMLKLAMVIGGPQIREVGYGFVNCVHDELDAEGPKKYVREAAIALKGAMLKAADLILPGFPFDAELSVGRAWGSTILNKLVEGV